MSSGRVLLVDDDPGILSLVRDILHEEGMPTVTAETGGEALARLRGESPDAAILDLFLPDVPGRDLLERFRLDHPHMPVVVLTGGGGVADAVECMRLGAFDFLQKPFERTRLVASVRNALAHGRLLRRVESLARELRESQGFDRILGESPPLRRAVDLLHKAAESDVTLLLEGESGTGKEIAAKAVHAGSVRRPGPFVVVNCGAIPEGLIESELFGHEKGSFTGAVESRRGHFERADGGTLFLDEVGELRLDLQVRLLRVLQEREIVPVGGSEPRRVDIRVIAATHRDLRRKVEEGGFREDLYYRLAVFPVRLPPLREREGDIPLLAEAFFRAAADRLGKTFRPLSLGAARALAAYAWPGNIRELENVCLRATILEEGSLISLGSLPEDIVCAFEEELAAGDGAGVAPPAAEPPERAELPTRERSGQGEGAGSPGPPAGEEPVLPLEEVERRAILAALERTRWRIPEAATLLKIGRATLYRRVDRYGLLARKPVPRPPL